MLVDAQGYVKLCDYGLSKFLPLGERTRTHVGTLAYIPPEHLNGDSYDHSTDLWSLGVTVYEMAYGITPFEPSEHSGGDGDDPSNPGGRDEWRSATERNIRTAHLRFPGEVPHRRARREGRGSAVVAAWEDTTCAPRRAAALARPVAPAHRRST